MGGFPSLSVLCRVLTQTKTIADPRPAGYKRPVAESAARTTGNDAAREVDDLGEACRAGDAARVRQLLDSKASPNQLNPEGQSPLMLAALNGHEPVVALLLSRGADANQAGAMGWTAAHFAAVHEGNDPVLRALGRAGGEIDARDADDCTPLLLAASGGCEANVRCLLDLGADIDALNAEVDTPLSCACRLERVAVAKLLVTRGADVSRSERHLVSPLHWAVSRGDNACIEMMLRHGAEIDRDPPGCPPLVTWIARAGLSEATVTRLLRESRQTAEWMEVLRALVERSGRADLKRWVEASQRPPAG